MDDFFNSDEKLPSPPRVNMTLGEAHEMMMKICPNYKELNSEDPHEYEKYCKLMYAVVRRFFENKQRDTVFVFFIVTGKAISKLT